MTQGAEPSGDRRATTVRLPEDVARWLNAESFDRRVAQGQIIEEALAVYRALRNCNCPATHAQSCPVAIGR